MHLHMSELLHHDDAIGQDGPNDINVSWMVSNGLPNNDGGYPEIHKHKGNTSRIKRHFYLSSEVIKYL